MILEETLRRRADAANAAVRSLAYLQRPQAIAKVLSWISLDELERYILPTLTRDAPETDDSAEYAFVRFRKVLAAHHLTLDDRTDAGLIRILKEALKEAA